MPKFAKGSDEMKKFMASIRAKRQSKEAKEVKSIASKKGNFEPIEIEGNFDTKKILTKNEDKFKVLAEAVLGLQDDIEFIMKKIN
jgi:hypothetical protein